MIMFNIEMTKQTSDEDIRVLQIGEGKLLRGLIEPIIHQMRIGGWKGLVAMTNIRESGAVNINGLKKQGGKYNVVFRDQNEISALEIGFVIPILLHEEWARVVSIAENPNLLAIITNSTEAGYKIDSGELRDTIAPNTFIGVITALLYKRFSAKVNSPITVLPTELITKNGNVLAKKISEQADAWKLGNEFKRWINKYVLFRNTLVDRIVTDLTDKEIIHFLKNKEGYVDHYACMAEKYGKWWIERSYGSFYTLPLHIAKEVELVDDISSYEEMKLWILNGAHLYMACKGLQLGLRTVFEASRDTLIMNTVKKYWNDVREVINLPKDTVDNFISNTEKRFRQEWLNHQLFSIAVNIREKWRIRIESFMKAYQRIFGFQSNPAIEMTIAIAEYLSKIEKTSVEKAINSLSEDKSIIEASLSKYNEINSKKTGLNQ